MTKIGLIGCEKWGKLILRDSVSLGYAVTVVAVDVISRRNAEA